MSEIRYLLSAKQRHRHFLDLRADFPAGEGKVAVFQLPAWRPGRYELGNFARNIQRIVAKSETGDELPLRKVSKDRWEVIRGDAKRIVLEYRFFAGELNAGSTWVDDQQIYVNPVNCFFYRPDFDAPYVVTVEKRNDEEIACGASVVGPTIHAAGVQEIMDSPLIVAAGMTHWQYKAGGATFHIWINGRHVYREQPVVEAFKKFSDKMIEVFGDIPCDAYHFLFQLPDRVVRHGVEHSTSTVIALGPAEFAATQAGWEELLGISCHELYHTWNIKSIRPKEMMPYDFSRENYSRLGYVAEGVTTYYGDLFLLRSGVFSLQTYLSLLADQIKRHLHNAGRFNMSVADSSFDTWLDGYSPGIPDRKVSIYTEGCLTAFMTDIEIMRATEGSKSLDHVMTDLYNRFGKNEKGYTEAHYQKLVEGYAGDGVRFIFDQHINGTEDYLPALKRALKYVGIQLRLSYTASPEHVFGFQLAVESDLVVQHVWPDSPADLAGISRGDKLVAVNDIAADAWWKQTVGMKKGVHTFLVERGRKMVEIKLRAGKPAYYPEVALELKKETEGFCIWTHKK